MTFLHANKEATDVGTRLANRWMSLLGAALALHAGAWLAGCSRSAEPPTQGIRPVQTMTIADAGSFDVRVFPGRVDAAKKAELTFMVPGLLIELPVKEGQTVAAGDVIARLRQDEFVARKAVVVGQLDQARARLTALMA